MRDIPTMIQVLEAAFADKTIQMKRPGENGEAWRDVSYPSWNFNDFDYRIKPEPPKPREFCVSGSSDISGHLITESKPFHSHRAGYFRVREVLDDPSVHSADQRS